jgi:DNA-binding HxlR family transcriptional regulator
MTKPKKTQDLSRLKMNSIRESMLLLTGKWKVYIIGTLLYSGKMRFMDLQREIKGIGSKMLSKELQDLEGHQLITRTIVSTKPLIVEYDLSNLGKTLEPFISSIAQWGIDYREALFGKKDDAIS